MGTEADGVPVLLSASQILKCPNRRVRRPYRSENESKVVSQFEAALYAGDGLPRLAKRLRSKGFVFPRHPGFPYCEAEVQLHMLPSACNCCCNLKFDEFLRRTSLLCKRHAVRISEPRSLAENLGVPLHQAVEFNDTVLVRRRSHEHRIQLRVFFEQSGAWYDWKRHIAKSVVVTPDGCAASLSVALESRRRRIANATQQEARLLRESLSRCENPAVAVNRLVHPLDERLSITYRESSVNDISYVCIEYEITSKTRVARACDRLTDNRFSEISQTTARLQWPLVSELMSLFPHNCWSFSPRNERAKTGRTQFQHDFRQKVYTLCPSPAFFASRLRRQCLPQDSVSLKQHFKDACECSDDKHRKTNCKLFRSKNKSKRSEQLQSASKNESKRLQTQIVDPLAGSTQFDDKAIGCGVKRFKLGHPGENASEFREGSDVLGHCNSLCLPRAANQYPQRVATLPAQREPDTTENEKGFKEHGIQACLANHHEKSRCSFTSLNIAWTYGGEAAECPVPCDESCDYAPKWNGTQHVLRFVYRWTRPDTMTMHVLPSNDTPGFAVDVSVYPESGDSKRRANPQALPAKTAYMLNDFFFLAELFTPTKDAQNLPRVADDAEEQHAVVIDSKLEPAPADVVKAEKTAPAAEREAKKPQPMRAVIVDVVNSKLQKFSFRERRRMLSVLLTDELLRILNTVCRGTISFSPQQWEGTRPETVPLDCDGILVYDPRTDAVFKKKTVLTVDLGLDLSGSLHTREGLIVARTPRKTRSVSGVHEYKVSVQWEETATEQEGICEELRVMLFYSKSRPDRVTGNSYEEFCDAVKAAAEPVCFETVK